MMLIAQVCVTHSQIWAGFTNMLGALCETLLPVLGVPMGPLGMDVLGVLCGSLRLPDGVGDMVSRICIPLVHPPYPGCHPLNHSLLPSREVQ